MKQINVLSTIFTSALLESNQYGLIINLKWYSLHLEEGMLIHLVWRCNWWQTKRILEGKKHQLH